MKTQIIKGSIEEIAAELAKLEYTLSTHILVINNQILVASEENAEEKAAKTTIPEEA